MKNLRNTEKSEQRTNDFLAQKTPFKRKEQTYTKEFSFPAKEVFPQFCPSREEDWIDGWAADLIYTSTGYVESDCIFSTSATNILGPGLWIFTELIPDKKVELIRIVDNSMVIHFRIYMEDHGNNTSTGVWKLKFTAINEQGNKMVEMLPAQDPGFAKIIDSLQYFLENGVAMKLRG